MLLARRDNNNWMTNLFNDFFDGSWMPRMNATAPAVNVKETPKSYEMELAAPGLKKEYCRVSVDADGNLNIKMEDKFEHKEEEPREEEKKEHYLRREFSYANYEQSYVLPDDVDRDKISARVSDGILHIELPKLTAQEEDKETRKIEVG